MRLLNAWTQEPDEPEIAIAELLGQLDLEHNLLANAAGFLTCSYDFVETGMVRSICEALPFDVVGCTTLTNAIDGTASTMQLCLSVLTADDCSFSCALSEPLADRLCEATGEAWRQAEAALPAPPALTLAFLPLISSVGGELILDALNTVAVPCPIFGTIACDFDTAEYSNTFTLHNGECFRDRMALMLISGNVQPRFVVTATSEQNLHRQQAIITASEGSILKEVNGMSARDYFKTLGLMPGEGIEGMSSVPFVVDYQDGTQPVARAIYHLNEDGSAVCGGVMPEGGTLSIGRMDVEDILLTAEQSTTRLLADKPDCAGLILLPCLGRNMVLTVTPFAEVEKVASVIDGRVPWHLAYSGGEVCPVYDGDGRPVNRFHNFTFIGCAI